LHDVMPFLSTRMRKEAFSRDNGIHQAAELLGHLDTLPTRVLALTPPVLGLGAEVVVALHQVVGRLHQDGAKPAVAASPQWAGRVDLVALIAAGHQPGPTGDGV